MARQALRAASVAADTEGRLFLAQSSDHRRFGYVCQGAEKEGGAMTHDYTPRELTDILARHSADRRRHLAIALTVMASAGVVAGIALVLIVQWVQR